MEKQALESLNMEQSSEPTGTTERPAYEAPRVTVMDEADVLKTFQFTSAGITWWVM